MRFPTMWYVRTAKPQISLCIRAVWSEPLLVDWICHDWTSFGVSKLKKRLHRLIWVYTCQNVIMLEVTCHIYINFTWTFICITRSSLVGSSYTLLSFWIWRRTVTLSRAVWQSTTTASRTPRPHCPRRPFSINWLNKSKNVLSNTHWNSLDTFRQAK